MVASNILHLQSISLVDIVLQLTLKILFENRILCQNFWPIDAESMMVLFIDWLNPWPYYTVIGWIVYVIILWLIEFFLLQLDCCKNHSDIPICGPSNVTLTEDGEICPTCFKTLKEKIYFAFSISGGIGLFFSFTEVRSIK